VTVTSALGLLAEPGSLDIGDHLALHGPLPSHDAEALLSLAEREDLRGRGGAGFPLARKLRTAAAARGRPLVIANATEGEPAIRKDATLLAVAPHLVLDGVVLACRAVGAREGVVAVHPGPGATALRAAVGQRSERPQVHEVPRSYVAGESSALTRSVLGGPALPVAGDVPLAVRGPGGRPVLVQNVETLAALALHARYPGRRPTTLLTVRGHDVQVLELPMGASIGSVLALAHEHDAQAVLVGGYTGTWLPTPFALDVPMSHAAGTLGAGLLLALPHDVCTLTAVSALTRYLASQSAGQCGPCANGLPALAACMEALAAGNAPGGTLDRLLRLAGLVEGRGACGLPDGVASMLRSALDCFASDVEVHLSSGCGRAPAELPA